MLKKISIMAAVVALGISLFPTMDVFAAAALYDSGSQAETEMAIKTVTFNEDGTSVVVTAIGTNVAGIYINHVFYPGTKATYTIPPNTKYITVQVEDISGNTTDEVKKRVPGWSQVTDTITIQPVKFTSDNTKATITAECDTQGVGIKGIYVDGEFQKGNPVTYTVPKSAKYLQLQAVNDDWDKSQLYDVRVPGWLDIRQDIKISSAEFSDDNTMIMVAATETAGFGVAGIYINDEFHKGNPVLAIISDGEKHLKLQAENGQGDRSPILTKRVPGWSQIVDTLKIASVEFTGQNKIATITGVDTSGKSVTGIYVNDMLLEGNPAIYMVPEGAKTLKVQAQNINGDLSAIVNQPVPEDEPEPEPEPPSSSDNSSSDSSNKKSSISISIKEPDWTNTKKAKVKVSVSAKKDKEIDEIWATTDEDEDWDDITSSKTITITEDTTVTVNAVDEDGNEKEVSKDIECFDFDPPTISASQNNDIVTIRADDKKSGVERVTVGGNTYSGADAKGGIQIKAPANEEVLQIEAHDYAGNVKTSTFGLKIVKTKSATTAAPSSSRTYTAPASSQGTITVAPQPRISNDLTDLEEDQDDLPGEKLNEIAAIPEEPLILSPSSPELESSDDESEDQEEPLDPEPPEKKGNPMGVIVGLVALLALMGGGGWYFWTHIRRHPNEAMFDDDDEFEDEEDEDTEFILPDEPDLEPEQVEQDDLDSEPENVEDGDET